MRRSKGAATLLYLSLMSIIIVLILSLSYSRLILALRRSQSLADSITTGYAAESKIFDTLAILIGGYRSFENLGLPLSFMIGDTKLEIEGVKEDTKETITVTASRAFSVSKIEAVREASGATTANELELLLMLDCTSSMNAKDGRSTTRYEEQEAAAIDFIDSLADISDSNNIGVGVFGLDAYWLTSTVGIEVKPGSGLSFDQIKQAISDGFGDTLEHSPVCADVMDNTSIGSGLAFMNQHFRNSPAWTGVKRVEVLISDGEPNARIPHSRFSSGGSPGVGQCTPDVFCPEWGWDNYCSELGGSNPYGWACYPPLLSAQPGTSNDPWDVCFPKGLEYLSCALATNSEFWSSGKRGDRDPSVDAYIVTVLQNPRNEVKQVFLDYATEYYNISNANQLKAALESVLGSVSESVQAVTIRRLIPGEE